MSFVSDLLKPGGGIALIPFIRGTILLLLMMVILMGIFDVARIHMVVLAFLSVGLLVSISMFERAWNDVQRNRSNAPVRIDKEAEKTD